jgi:hypothetical protein
MRTAGWSRTDRVLWFTFSKSRTSIEGPYCRRAICYIYGSFGKGAKPVMKADYCS